MNATPAPAPVRGNDWRSLGVAPSADFEPELGVSVVIPYYEAPEQLQLTLAALEAQTYPLALFEVVIVDDGSAAPLAAPDNSPLSLRVLHQKDQGFGAARARNNGARAASNPILVFLDCDMMPEAGWLAAHARWHHAACDVLSLGFRRHVEVSGVTAEALRSRPGSLAEFFACRPSEEPEWIEGHMARSDDLTNGDDRIFRVVTGGNLGVSKEFYETVGGYDESFKQWGGEDTEFGYRALAMGAVLAPERDALCWHQGPGARISEQERQSLTQQQGKLLNLIPHGRPRGDTDGRCFTVPAFVVSVPADSACRQDTLQTVQQVLASRVHDLAVWVEEHPDAGDDGLGWLRSHLDGDPRVHFGEPGGAATAFAATRFHVKIPAGAALTPFVVGRLRRQLGDAAAGRARLESGHQVTITRSWALQRALRRGVPAHEVGEVVDLDGRALAAEPRPARDGDAGADEPLSKLPGGSGRATTAAKALLRYSRAAAARASKVRSPGDAREFLAWAAAALKRRTVARRTDQTPPGIDRARLARYPLGAELAACGDRAAAVFAASARVGVAVGEQPVDLLLVDTAKAGRSLAEAGSPSRSATQPRVAVLSELPNQFAVPAFDPATLNPIGWRPEHEAESASLSSLWSPPAPSDGPALLHLDHGLISRLRKLHHVEDSGAGMDGATERAATLAALAAAGVVVRVTRSDSALANCLGAGLHGLMADDAVAAADPGAREQLSIAMRRCALRDHSLRARGRQILSSQGFEAPPPEVTVLLATRRPEHFEAALDAVRAQNYPRLELVVALHGDGFGDETTLRAAVADLDCPTTIVRAPADKRLGEVLNAAVAASSGALITKFDDDDYYSADHIWDLVLAREYSGAMLVAKAAEFVYLAQRDCTVRVDKMRERFVPDPVASGGVLMISRQDLQDAGGWRRVPRRVDICLARDVKQVGGRIYWTHGAGYLRVRHGDEHTWTVGDEFFLGRSNEMRPGRDFEFAGF
ncbi:MAG: glycosyltransferase [Acidimicrobiaceae bacterium]|nr:glycosyltransferase [Acidimicrobiaceae bacterium]